VSSYYFASSGSDGNAGTSELLPWRTTANLRNVALANGDHLIFRQGDVFHLIDTLTIECLCGVVIASSGSERSTLVANARTAITVRDCESIRVERIALVHEGYKRTTSHGLFISCSNRCSRNIRIDSLHITGFGGYGILALAEGSGVGCRDVSVVNSSADGNVLGGIVFTSTSLIARSCAFRPR